MNEQNTPFWAWYFVSDIGKLPWVGDPFSFNGHEGDNILKMSYFERIFGILFDVAERIVKAQ